MKKILISLLIVLVFVLLLITMINGLKIGGMEILGFNQIIEKSKYLDETILSATTIASTDYEKVQKDIETDIKKLKEEKKKYDELVTISTGSEVQAANQYQKYEIEYLWTIVGNHATKEGVVIKMDLVAGTGENVYNLNFTVNGEYIGIADFISDIENDSALGFKIENFSLVPSSSTQSLKATFVCKDITIRDIASSVKATPATDKTTGTDEKTTEKETTEKETTEKDTDSKETNTNDKKTTNDDIDEKELEDALTKLDRE